MIQLGIGWDGWRGEIQFFVEIYFMERSEIRFQFAGKLQQLLSIATGLSGHTDKIKCKGPDTHITA